MKKWSLIVAVLYGLTLLVLFYPLLWLAFSDPGMIADSPKALRTWQLWLIVAIMMVAQFALLRLPIRLANRRPVTRRPLLSTVIAAAFMMGLLIFGAGLSLYEVFTRLEGKGDGMWIALAMGIGSWVAWAIYFYRATKPAAPDPKLGRIRRFLWTGSILELLVAVPTHIVARSRGDCCAGFLTFVGLVCGMSVMVFAFGPAVYFIFVERWRRLHPEPEAV